MPILTLFVGMLFIPIAESFKENYCLNKLKKFVISCLKQIHEQVQKQATKINERLENIDDFGNENIIPIKISVNAIKDLQKTETADLFKILVNKRKGKDNSNIEEYKVIINTVDFFSESLNLIFEVSQKTVSDINKYSDDWNKSQMNILSYINQFITISKNNGIDPNTDEFLKQIIFNQEDNYEKYGLDIPNIEISYLEYIRPIIEISKKHTGDERAYLLLQESQQSRLAYDQLKKTRERIKKYFQSTYNDIVESNSKLEKIIEKLN